MESKGVLLPLIHDHPMIPWNDMRKGSCCGRFEATSDGYLCEKCDYFFHKKCSESFEFIQHPSHPSHTLQLQSCPDNSCDFCGNRIQNLCYHCDICDFDVDLHCVKYPPPKVIEDFERHPHKLTLLEKSIHFDCAAKCGINDDSYFHYGFPYKCHECDLYFHVDCVWHPREEVFIYTNMESKGVSLPLIHDHPMIPWNDMRKGSCCERFEATTDGYLCKKCDYFLHKKCSEFSEFIQHPSHPSHTLQLQSCRDHICDFCEISIQNLSYSCSRCNFDVHLFCAKHPPPKVINHSETHPHKLTLLEESNIHFYCAAKCGINEVYGFPYECRECNLYFHVDCIWHPSEKELKYEPEVQHSYHSLHPLKLINGHPPSYSDGKCRLCGRMVDRFFYHCSLCNFTLGMCCVLHPPPKSHMDLKDHCHYLILLPRLISFTCNACGLNGDRSPYVCFSCDFFIHKDCLGLPRVININRHDHLLYRISLIGVANSACGVCRQKVDWTWGGYSCQKCLDYFVHSKCATNKNVWNGEELEGIPEAIEDVESYVVIDDNTIQHFSHKEHHLRLNVNDILYDDNKRCKACTHPICLQSSYGCLDCDFILHQNCAKLPKKKWHVLDSNRLTLVTSEVDFFECVACNRDSNGFRYGSSLDVMCGSISEPFFHPSHVAHLLYYILPNEDQINEGDGKLCNGCNSDVCPLLKCIEDDCGFVLCFKCATLPQVVKHRVDDHPLSLCYGEEETSGKYWYDICEEETDPEEWFYTCKDQRASLHVECVLGDFLGLMPRSMLKIKDKSYEVMLNNSITRPFCKECKSYCIYPIMLKLAGSLDTYFCSFPCHYYYLRNLDRIV